ncbi:NAD(P)-dependent oxidoreductase [Weissella confusa]|uniref:NAD(P)-dependent oxidoreductase n=1 Tax=Weissella confusa TaxID=1583 RepID=UPI00223A988B|nr:NAD(P)-binding oxidoreductase [Weissella confusa]MCT0013702.1 NAD(P)-dependent oxidoreductase [Weissella confusa]
MKILVFGATGKTGREITQQALLNGDEVVAYVRHPEKLTNQTGLTIIGGQLNETKRINHAMQGVDAVLVALGAVNNSGVEIMAPAVSTIIAVAQQAGVKRLIVLSALGVAETIANTAYPYKVTVQTFLAKKFLDHDKAMRLLQASELDWTTIHPGLLLNGDETANLVVKNAAMSGKVTGWAYTNRADVAATMLRVVSDLTTVGQQLLVLSNAKSKA